MSETGTVIQIAGELVRLEIPRSKACGGCRACMPLDGKDSMTTYALNLCGAQVGDLVEIEPGQSRQLFSSALLYGIPLVVFLALIFLFSLFAPEPVTVAAACGGVVLSYLLLHFFSRRLDQRPYTHKAVRILPRG